MKRLGRKLLLALVAVLATAVTAWAFYGTGGAGTSSANTLANLTAPVVTVPDTSTGSHTVSWTAASLTGNPSDASEITYTVERKLETNTEFDPVTTGGCAAPLGAATLSCTDSVGASGDYDYRVVAEFRTWTATSAPVGPVEVTVGGGDTTAPDVESIARAGTSPTKAGSVDFTVTFSENVTGVDATDFDVATTGGVTGTSVDSVTGSGNEYTVTVDTGTGDGTVGLDLDDDDSIVDGGSNKLGGTGTGNGNLTGEVYAIDKSAPTVQSINRADASPTNATSVRWTVTFSESVSGVGTADFALATSGVSGASITGVTGSGSSYTVTAGTGSGSGSLGLNLVDDDSIADAASNKLGGTGTGNGNLTGQGYTIDRTAPQLQTLEMFDDNLDGRIDRVDATFDEPLAASGANTTTGWTTNNRPGGVTFGSVSVSASTATLNFTGGTASTSSTAVGTFTIALSSSTGQIRDALGNKSAISPAQAPTDKAAPVVLSIVRTGGTGATNAASVGFTASFTESVTAVDTADFATATTGSLSGTSVTNVTGSGATRTVTASTGGAGAGTLGVNVLDNDTIQDAAASPNKLGGPGNGNGDFTTGQTYTIDKLAPQLVTLDMRDIDTDGRVDRLVATFDETIQSTSETANWILTNIPGGGSKGSASTTLPSTVTVEIGEGSVTTALGSFTVQLNQHASGVRDALGNQSSFTARAPADDASPVPTALTDTPGANNGLWETGDTATLTFSETVTNTVNDSDVVLTGGSGSGGNANDSWQAPGFLSGTLGRSDYISTNGSVANFADAGLDQPNPNQVRLTLPACSSGACGLLTNAGGNGNIALTPATTIRDLAAVPNTAVPSTALATISFELF